MKRKLRRGRKTHCGCNFPLKKNISGHSGQTFGLITAVEHEKDYQSTGKIYWKCYCACSPEKFFYVLGNDFSLWL